MVDEDYTTVSKEPTLKPNEERHQIRALLAEKRRLCYNMTFHVRSMRIRGKEPSIEKLNRLRALRKECKELSRRLSKTPPYVYIRSGEPVWLGKAFKRFRHSARATRWVKKGWKWARRLV